MAADQASSSLDDQWDLIPDDAPVKFDSAEHADIPSECYLKFTANPSEVPLSGKAEEGRKLATINPPMKKTLTFAEVIALAGDFYVNKPETDVICYGKTFEVRKNRFDGAVLDISQDPTRIIEALTEDYLKPEVAGIDKVLGDLGFEPTDPKARQPDPAKATGADKETIDKTKILGTPLKDLGVNEIVYNYKEERKDGGVTSIKSQMVMVGLKEYGKILVYNMDHFGAYAWDAYRAGHYRALEIAKIGSKNEAKLGEAYLYDAFALHYLSDQFSAGHSRTPRMEFSYPGASTSAMATLNGVLGSVSSNIAPYKTCWDNATNLLHDIDNATGFRVSNLNGDQWVVYGDAQYFIEANRVNRLKSIECVQASIDETYQTWLTGNYPEGASDASGKLQENFTFAALKVAPVPVGHTVEENTESNGNPSQLWVVQRDETTQNPQQILQDGDKGVQSKATAKDHPRISGSKHKAYIGYFFARRSVPEECSVTEYQWAYPGMAWLPAVGVHQDVAAVEGTNFYQNDRMREEARAVEILSGGFLQVSEYRDDKEKEKMNYAVNAWGPIQVPTIYVSKTTLGLGERKGKQRDLGDRMLNRQMTFTLRGRTQRLKKDPEVSQDSKTFRWLSWFDPSGSGKTALLRFALSIKDNDQSRTNAIVVDSWSFTDQDKNLGQQWTQYEQMRPDNRIEFGGPDRKNPKIDVNRLVLLSPYTLSDWTLFARLARFFVFPFRQGSSPNNPDLITMTWKFINGVPKPTITVASTEKSLSNPKVTITSTPKFEEQPGPPSYGGFIKRFEDVNNKGMILYAKAIKQNGVSILSSIFQQDGSKNDIASSSAALQTPMVMAPTNEDFYQVLVGDTRKSGHRELIAMTGQWPNYCLSAWELTGNGTWNSTTPNNAAFVPPSKVSEALATDKSKKVRHLFCALIPNEPKANGLNVLLVSSYGDNNEFINFRTFIKDGAAAPIDPVVPKDPNPSTAGQSIPQVPKPLAPSYTWVIVNWGPGLSSMVPSWCFTPPSRPLASGQGVLQWDPTDGWGDDIKGGSAGRNSWATYDQWGSVASSFGEDDRAYFWVKPVPGPPQRDFKDPGKNPVIDMSIVDGLDPRSGSIVPTPLPYIPGPHDATTTGDYTPVKSKGDLTPTTISGDGFFDEATPRSLCGRYQAIARDVSKIQPAAIVKDTGNGLKLFAPNGAQTIRERWCGVKTLQGQIIAHDAGEFNSEIGIDENWLKDVQTEYYFDTVTNKPTAAMFKRGVNARYRILNPEFLFKRNAKPPPPKSSLSAPAPPALLMEPPINQISTASVPVVRQPRAAAGWMEYVDCPVQDSFGKHNNFNSMGWRMCKVASTVRKMDMVGVMQVFSFHGNIGVRVWAPREPGQYQSWISRGMNPYLGQTSLGTGYDSLGRWNDNASQLSWGATQDFEDINYWNDYWAADGKEGKEGKSWAQVSTMVQVPEKKGFEAKWPRNVDPKPTQLTFPPGMKGVYNAP